MATFNTAFGSLPTPKDELFGSGTAPRKSTTSGTGQIEQGSAPGSTMNFADMQKNGIARPAPVAVQTQQPPMLTSLDEQLKQPVAAAAPPPQASTAPDVPPMISALQTTLPQPTSTAPVPAAAPAPTTAPEAAAPVGGAPVPVSAPAAATAPAPQTNTSTRNPDGSITVTNPETPVANPPTFKAGTVPDPNAPNGSTFTSSTGQVWTKRNGLWSYEKGDLPPGYEALVPVELLGQTNTSAAAQGIQATGGKGLTFVEEFLTRVGLPNSEEQWTLLATNAGLTVAQVKSFANSERGKILFSDQVRQQDYVASQQYAAANGYPPSGMRWIPERFRNGGPEIVAEDSPEGQAYLNFALNKTPASSTGSGGATGGKGSRTGDISKGDGLVLTGTGGSGTGGSGGGGEGGGYSGGGGYIGGGSSGGGGGGTQGQSFYTAPKNTYTMPDYNTLLASLGTSLGTGAPQAGGYAGSTQALELRKQLEEQLKLLAAGSDTQKKAFDATRGARSAELTAQYGAERSKLEEDLAARGLSASTIGGGRYGDLAGQQARAMASFEADMLKQQSEAEARDRALYMSTMSDLAGMAGTQDLGAYEANLKAKQIQSDIAFRAAELQQEAALKGRDLDLQSARDQATSQYQAGQLGLGYAEMRSREQMQREDQTFRAGESELERNIRLRLQGNDIASQEKIAGLDRDLRDKIASGELTLNQGITLGNIAQRIWDGSLDLSYWDTAVTSLGLNPKNFPRPPVNPNNKNSNTPPPNPDTSGNPPRQENPPPAATLQNYTPGTRFNIRGVIYTLDSSGRLFDPAGRQYNYSDD